MPGREIKRRCISVRGPSTLLSLASTRTDKGDDEPILTLLNEDLKCLPNPAKEAAHAPEPGEERRAHRPSIECSERALARLGGALKQSVLYPVCEGSRELEHPRDGKRGSLRTYRRS